MFSAFIAELISAVSLDLPGEKAQLKMSPSQRDTNPFKQPGLPREAAVLLLLFPLNNEPNIVFTKRHNYKGPHGGQISLPGGKKEKEDSSLEFAALRETMEETGIDMESIEIIGKLSPLHIPVSSFTVHPFLGYLHEIPVFQPDPFEVEELITIPLQKLFDDAIKDKETLHINDHIVTAPFYNVSGHHLWGATAMIISEFEEIYKSIGL